MRWTCRTSRALPDAGIVALMKDSWVYGCGCVCVWVSRASTQTDACLRCQGESKKDSYGKQDCVVVWGECNHSFHFCCMSLWVKQNNRCPLCQQEWSIQRMGK
ncbi:unnamed protein product [Danaus chrysippus]|uniref:(African queen) hypothetical protein n=1 Tax=Danaus chrysippus TaxID=151541 RepID=A0A8J2R5L5_9NEOP|nr:unnamed protein product [Danaus chrysippus]